MEHLIKKLSNLLSLKDEILFAYLFGSQAKGTANSNSDIDVALFLDTEKELPESAFGYKANMIEHLSQELNKKVDIVILNEASILLRFQVINHGKLILCRAPKERVHFFSKTMSQYHDFKPALEVQRKYLHQRIKDGTFGGGERHG